MIFSFLFGVLFFLKGFLAKKNSLAKLLYYFFFLLSILSIFHLDIINQEVTLINVLNFIFISFIFTILIDGFNNFTKINYINTIIFSSFQRRLIIITSLFGLITLFFNVYLVYNIYNYHTIAEIAIDILKNENGADDYFKANHSRIVRTISHLFSPLGYLFLSLHFYFLSKNKLSLGFIYLILSLSIPLHGMQGLSRAAPAQYVLLYFSLYYYFNNTFSERIRFLMKKVLILTFAVICTYFLYTSFSRFGDNFYYINKLDGEINPNKLIFYSIIDYTTQWLPYGIESLNFYTIDITLVFSNFRPLYDYLGSMLGFDKPDLSNHFSSIYGHFSSKFIGLIPTLIFDMGYFLTLMFALFFRILLRKSSSYINSVSFADTLKLPIFLTLILMAFANAWLAYLLFHIAIVYTIFFIFIFSKKVIS
jgi:hypothetical protein